MANYNVQNACRDLGGGHNRNLSSQNSPGKLGLRVNLAIMQGIDLALLQTQDPWHLIKVLPTFSAGTIPHFLPLTLIRANCAKL